MPKWLNAALAYIAGWLEFQFDTTSSPAARLQWATRRGRLRGSVRVRRSQHGWLPDAAAPLPRRFAFEELRRGGGREAGRGAAPAARGPGGPLRRRPAPGARSRNASPSLLYAPAWCATAPTAGSSSIDGFPLVAGAARRSREGADPQAQRALQVLQPRLRPARVGDRSRDRRALPLVAAARDHRCGGARRNRGRRPSAEGTPLALGHSARLPAGARLPIPGDYSTNALARGGRCREHREGPGALLLAPLAGREAGVLSAASRRGDDPAALARSRFQHRALLRAGRRQRQPRGLGLVRALGRSAGLRHPHLRAAGAGLALGAHQCGRRPGAPMAGGLRPDPARVRRRRRAGSQAASWTGRWWTLWNPIDLVAVGNKVLVARPDFFNPFLDASEIEPRGRSHGRIVLVGYASHGEPAAWCATGAAPSSRCASAHAPAGAQGGP